MPPAGEDKDYEVWSVGDDGAVSVGLMEPDPDGKARAQLVDDLDDASALAITVEPEGGSPSGQPSSDPIVNIDLT
jgi:anti-sigma-K factor RskA